MVPRGCGSASGFLDCYKCVSHFVPALGISFPLSHSLLLPSANQSSLLHLGGVNVLGLLLVVPSRALSLQKSLAVVCRAFCLNQLCFLFSVHLGIILLIMVLKLGSQTDRELSEATDSFGVGEEADLTGIYLGELMLVELH